MRLAAVAALLSSFAAMAQEAPAPRKSPRMPVEGQPLANAQITLPPSHEVSGTATIIDGEKLRIDGIDLRLFGIVPPQLSASFGPQARGLLDQLSAGQSVTCHVRDRDHDGRFLATCRVGSNDLAFELIKRGLAVTARGSLSPTELAAPYEAAEQVAEAEKLGLWSTVQSPAPVPAPAVTAPVKAEAAAPLPPNLPASKKEEKLAAETPAQSAAPAVSMPAPAPEKAAAPVVASAPPAVVVSAPPSAANSDAVGFVARYQLIITTLLMFATALGVSLALGLQRWRDRRDERKAIAAALRGELLAARAVCLARLKTWSDADEKGWPRIRATLYQAYVGRLGQMGATLARQVASIYGQSSDYAIYYNTAAAHGEFAGKRHALETLMQHIEEVLPKLALIEQSGALPKEEAVAKAPPHMSEPPAPPEEKILPPAMPTVSATPPAVTLAPVSPPASVETAAPAETVLPLATSSAEPAATPTPAPPTSTPVWDRMRNFVRISRAAKSSTPEDPSDYAALIEEEMASLSLDEDKPGEEPPTDLSRMGRL